MDLNYILAWIVGFSALSMLASSLRAKKRQPDWIFVTASILGALIAGYFWWPDWHGSIAAILWIALILAPAAISKRIDRAIGQRDYELAVKWSRWLRILHPARESRDLTKLLIALGHANAGSRGQCDALLENLSRSKSSIAHTARAHRYILRGDWLELRNWIDDSANGSSPVLSADVELIPSYLRSLGETGEIDRMIGFFPLLNERLVQANAYTLSHFATLVLLAFTGKVESVNRVLNEELSFLSAELKRFWLATACWSRGEHAAATAEFVLLLDSADPVIQQTARQRLASPAPVLPQAAHGPVIAALEEGRGAKLESSPQKTFEPRVTYALIALNCLVFLAEIVKGGSENPLVLFNMGALLPQLVLLRGEYYRLFAATFLHFGFLHLSLNMLGILILGRLVESMVGHARFLFLYLTCGIGSMVFIVWMYSIGQLPAQLVMGASGAVMGLIGASVSLLFLQWRKAPSRLTTERLKAVLINVAVQVLFDITTPQVSFSAHFGGFLIGLIFGLIIGWQRKDVEAGVSSSGPG